MSDEFTELFEAQLGEVFAAGRSLGFTLHHGGASVVFDGIVDVYPARLSGVDPGDLRVRVRASDLGAIVPGSPDTVVETVSGIVRNVISAVPEFGGLGWSLQCRRPGVMPAAEVVLALPVMTRAQRDAIGAVADGGIFYQSDSTPGLRLRCGGAWVKFTQEEDV